MPASQWHKFCTSRVAARLSVAQRDAVVPAGAGRLVGPAGPGQPVSQVVEVGLRDIDAERPDLAGFGLVVHVMTAMIRGVAAKRSHPATSTVRTPAREHAERR